MDRTKKVKFYTRSFYDGKFEELAKELYRVLQSIPEENKASATYEAEIDFDLDDEPVLKVGVFYCVAKSPEEIEAGYAKELQEAREQAVHMAAHALQLEKEITALQAAKDKGIKHD